MLCSKVCTSSFLADKYTEGGTNGLNNKGVQASTRRWFQKINNALTPRFLAYPSSTMESKKKSLSVIPLINEEGNYSIPGNACNNAGSQKSEPSLSVPAAPSAAATLRIPRKTSKYLHTHINACMQHASPS